MISNADLPQTAPSYQDLECMCVQDGHVSSNSHCREHFFHHILCKSSTRSEHQFSWRSNDYLLCRKIHLHNKFRPLDKNMSIFQDIKFSPQVELQKLIFFSSLSHFLQLKFLYSLVELVILVLQHFPVQVAQCQ